MARNALFNALLHTVVYAQQTNGEPIYVYTSPTKILQPDREATRTALCDLRDNCLKVRPLEQLRSDIAEAVSQMSDLYGLTHDGFRRIRNNQGPPSLSVSDVYAFSFAAMELLDLLSQKGGAEGPKVGIGVLAPAGQDCGKNLIRLVWRMAGFEVLDIGRKLPPTHFLSVTRDQSLQALGVSCMTSGCIPNLEVLCRELQRSSLNLPIVIGGIAVNRVLASDLSKRYGLRVFYGHDMRDAVGVLRKAIAGVASETAAVSRRHMQVSNVTHLLHPRIVGVGLHELRRRHVIIDDQARSGCTSCPDDRKALCPLELGFERQRTLQESHEELAGYDTVLLMTTPVPDDGDRDLQKRLWQEMLRLEQEAEMGSAEARIFRLPINCPFCMPNDCTIDRGACRLPRYYRPPHEAYNINIGATLLNAFGDDPPGGICALLFIRLGNE